MQGYSKGSVGPFMTVHYNVYVEGSLQVYSKVSLGFPIPDLYNDYLEAS
jgi:hypothetical protein